jgi:DNA-binding IclR family transcriptional regulator
MPLEPSPAVLRACDVLGYLAAHPTESFSVSDVARSIGMPRASCDSVLLALAQRNLVRRSPARRYSLGAACRSLGDAAGTLEAPLAMVEPIAEGLARATGSCVTISSCDRGATRVERVFDCAPPVAVRAKVGESVPLAAPFGAVFVAWNDETVDEWLQRGGVRGRSGQAHARTALGAIRARGYAVSTALVRPDLVQLLEDLVDGEPDPERESLRDELMRQVSLEDYLPVHFEPDRPQHVTQMSAPIFDANGAVLFSLRILSPGYRLRPDEIDLFVAQMLDAASRASSEVRERY